MSNRLADTRSDIQRDGESHRAAAYLARNLLSLRHARALTQEALAASSGLPRSTIANLESGEANPSLAVLMKVAHALGAPIDELLSAPHAKVRKWSVKEVGLTTRGRGVSERPLVPEPVPQELLVVMEFTPGAAMGGTPHLPGTREYFTCLEGEVRIMVAGEGYDLEAGEVLAFPGNVPHSYQNPGAKRMARGVSVVIFAKAGV